MSNDMKRMLALFETKFEPVDGQANGEVGKFYTTADNRLEDGPYRTYDQAKQRAAENTYDTVVVKYMGNGMWTRALSGWQTDDRTYNVFESAPITPAGELSAQIDQLDSVDAVLSMIREHINIALTDPNRDEIYPEPEDMVGDEVFSDLGQQLVKILLKEELARTLVESTSGSKVDQYKREIVEAADRAGRTGVDPIWVYALYYCDGISDMNRRELASMCMDGLPSLKDDPDHFAQSYEADSQGHDELDDADRDTDRAGSFADYLVKVALG